MTPTAGIDARISMAARSPSSVRSGGIWMSVTTTSGLCARLAQQVRRVAGDGDDLEALLLQDPHDADADEWLVFANDHEQRRRAGHHPTLPDRGALPTAAIRVA